MFRFLERNLFKCFWKNRNQYSSK